jgi:hypothetical protein
MLFDVELTSSPLRRILAFAAISCLLVGAELSLALVSFGHFGECMSIREFYHRQLFTLFDFGDSSRESRR